ncbi:hypothetical protein SARC_02352 [Sphaeroforma arctica JP610]|uniref:Uncharacterized protein n=1 Tax=Sphaeroforma arctica JP610 TaxID=667725 RepID=A0A0L0G8X6_9EUKA|nr:hypothetical protein SARC_02352 [Sphaeroforma arctica JP610]KNC85482.1 hypothetical protein SARC_02352 [Sphaeroforma arctica JP610]|eukprot:XP_014159384.1 hypothetical protein SARC_02352 [Sphaeroforma arctica JP610]
MINEGTAEGASALKKQNDDVSGNDSIGGGAINDDSCAVTDGTTGNESIGISRGNGAGSEGAAAGEQLYDLMEGSNEMYADDDSNLVYADTASDAVLY